MAISRRGQGSSNSCQKTAKARRNGNKTKLVALPAETENLYLSKENKESSKRLKWVWYAFLAAAAAICYAKTLFGEFVHDDIFAIKNNVDIRPETPILSLFWHDYWGQPLKSPASHKSFRPLSVLSFRAQFFSHGLNPLAYRLVNVLCHVVVTVLFVGVCETVLRCARLFSFLTGLLFSVHPIHAEAVNGIVGRADILACVFFLLAFKSYSSCIQCSQKKFLDKNRNTLLVSKCLLNPHWRSLMLCIVFGTAAMLAKENGITVFGVCIVYDIMVIAQCHMQIVRFNKKEFKNCKMDNKLLRRVAVLTSVVLILIYVRLLVQNGELPQFSADENPASYAEHWSTRFFTYSYLCFFNAWLLLLPLTLCYDWQMGSIPLIESWFDGRNLATLVFFLILISLFVMSTAKSILNGQERKILLTSLLFLTIPFLPASNVLFTVGFVVAERILYIPSLGYCILINFGFAKLAGFSVSNKDENIVLWPKTSRSKMASLIYVLMLGFFSWKTWQQSIVWQTRESLFRSGVDTLPQNAKVHFNYANYLEDAGRKSEAINHYQIALKLAPHHASSHNNLGILLTDPQEAMKHFKLAIKYNPYHANACLNLGALLHIQNKLHESEIYLKQSLRLNPGHGKTLAILADVLTKQGRFDEADQLLKQSIMKTPNDAVLYNYYGMFLAKNERFTEALSIYEKASLLEPNLAVPVLNKIHVLLAMGKLQDVEYYLKRFERNKDTDVLHQVGVIYYQVKRFSDAEKVWQEALRIDPTLTQTLFSYGILLKSQGRNKEALLVLRQCLKTNPQSADVNRGIVVLLHHMRYLNEALEAVNQVLMFDKNAVFYYQKGNILKDLRLYPEAIQAYETAIKLDSKYTDAYLNLGAVHHLMKNYGDAQVNYNFVLALDPLHEVAKRNLEKLAKFR